MTKGPAPVKRDRLLVFIRTYFEAHGFAPNYDTIGAAMRVRSRSSVHRMVERLVGQRAIAKAKVGRGLEVLQTKDYHLPGCICPKCDERRYIRLLKTYAGLRADPPFAVVAARKDNFRLLSDDTRKALLGHAAFPREAGR